MTEIKIYKNVGAKKLIFQKNKLKDHLQYYPFVYKHGPKKMKNNHGLWWLSVKHLMYSICDPVKGKPNGNLSKSLPAESYKKHDKIKRCFDGL